MPLLGHLLSTYRAYYSTILGIIIVTDRQVIAWMHRDGSKTWWRSAAGRNTGWQRNRACPTPPSQICSRETTLLRYRPWRRCVQRLVLLWHNSSPKETLWSWLRSNRRCMQSGVPCRTDRGAFCWSLWTQCKTRWSHFAESTGFMWLQLIEICYASPDML